MKLFLYFVACLLILLGLGLLTTNVALGIVLLALPLIVARMVKRRGVKHQVSMSVEYHNKVNSRQGKRKKRAMNAVGNIDSICPNCDEALDTKPGRKKKCPHCGEYIYVRKRPCDDQRVLLTAAQAEEIEEQWSIVNGIHQQYLARKRRFAQEKKRLAKKLGCNPSADDVTWSLLNQEVIEHAKNQNWGFYRNAKMQMAEIVRRESKLLEALGIYLEVCYLDLNGPNNTGGIANRDLLKDFPAWNPKQGAFLAPQITARIVQIMQKTGTDIEAVREIFVSRGARLRESLQLPVSVDEAWKKMLEFL